MAGEVAVGGALVGGLVVFMVGAVAWRIEYERDDSLTLVHADRRRRAWIHCWMLVAMLVTPAGVVGFAALSGEVLATMASVAYAVGALAWIVALTFRLTVVPWAAERAVATGTPPDGFSALDSWAGSLYIVHMAASYAVFALLGTAILMSDTLPHWSGWLGLGWGIAFLAGFVATRFAGPFNPPFWAHTYTALLGVVLLVT